MTRRDASREETRTIETCGSDERELLGALGRREGAR